MPNPKTVGSLLALQDEAVLSEMYKSIEAEIRRLEVEKQLLEEALSRKSRRSPRSRVPGESGRQSGVKRGDVLAVVREKAHPTTSPAEVRNALLLRGYEISGAAIRNHLKRLVADKALVTDGDGLYALAENDLPKNGSDDPLLTDGQNQSESLL